MNAGEALRELIDQVEERDRELLDLRESVARLTFTQQQTHQLLVEALGAKPGTYGAYSLAVLIGMLAEKAKAVDAVSQLVERAYQSGDRLGALEIKYVLRHAGELDGAGSTDAAAADGAPAAG